jgi:hypothetical protein
LYIAAGQDSDGNYSLVVVLDDGNNKSKLEESPMPEFDLRGAGEIMTAGVWKIGGESNVLLYCTMEFLTDFNVPVLNATIP